MAGFIAGLLIGGGVGMVVVCLLMAGYDGKGGGGDDH